MRPKAHLFTLGLILVLLPRAGWAQVEVSLEQIKIDNGGTAAANEISISSSNFDPNVIVAAWMDWQEGPPAPTIFTEKVRMGVGISTDGGSTWSDSLVRAPPGYQTNLEYDPMTAYDDRTGTFWVGAIAFADGTVNTDTLFVARKDPGQPSFADSVKVESSAVFLIDKGWMAAGPAPGNPEATRLYVAYNRGVARSSNMGATWSDPVNLGPHLGFLPRVAADGDLYVTYWDRDLKHFLRRSTDGGASFGDPVKIVTRCDTWNPSHPSSTGPTVPGKFRVPPLGYLAIDPNDETLYFVYFDTANMAQCDPGGSCVGLCAGGGPDPRPGQLDPIRRGGVPQSCDPGRRQRLRHRDRIARIRPCLCRTCR